MSTNEISKGALWAGRVMSALPILFLLMDSIGKFIMPKEVVDGTMELGYPVSVLFGLGVVLFISTLLYAIPQTSILGAILLTGYFGGAIATHVRVGNPWATHILFPVYFGVLIWGGLYLRNLKLRTLMPFVGKEK